VTANEPDNHSPAAPTRALSPRTTGDGDRPLDVLIVSTYYWPERAGNAPYVTGVAEYLAARGHHVVVATGFAHYPEWRSSGRGLLGIREHRRGVDIRRRRHYVPRKQSATTRALYEGSLCALGATALPRRAPDAIIGVSPTLAGAVLARAASTLYRRPYGVVFQDLQGIGALQSGVEGGKRISTLVERTELTLARGAAAVGVIAEGFRAYFEAHGVAPTHIHDLRNWSHDAHPVEDPAATRAKLGWSESDFVCLHAGNMGLKQGLENVLDAAALIGDPGIRIVLAGDGNDRARLEALASERALSNVSFLPPQPSGEYESMLRAADVLLVNQRATVGEMSLASKLTSYFVAGRPIIAAVAPRSETARELVRAGAGILAAPDDPSALAQAIERARLSVDPELGASGRRYAEQHLSAASVLEGYEEFVRTVSQGSAARGFWRRATAAPWNASDPQPVHLEPTSVRARDTATQPTVSVVIVSFDCREALRACLESLESQPPDLPIEVILVDNASSDGTVAMVRDRFPWVRLIANQANVGFARAANQGLALGQGSHVLFLNPDTIVPSGAIEKAYEELDRHPDVGMLGCKLVRPDGTFDHAAKRGFPTITSALSYFLRLNRLRPTSARFAQYTAGELGENDTGHVDAINGAFMLVRKEAAAAVGPMDERYWLYAEDLDWCHRFWEKGWKILYWPGVEVVHWKGGSSGDVRPWALNRAFHRSMWQFYDKHHAPHHGRLVSLAVWLGVWTKFGFSALVNAARKPPAHDWGTEDATSADGSRTKPGS
jgi:colanic acid biosynthesis glycosyl transferase WcaI